MTSMDNLVDMVLAESQDGETKCIDHASPEEAYEQRKVESLPIAFGVHDLERLYAYFMWRMFGC
jgi:hypothetical protein